jgi:hypothetical protein
MPNVFLYLYSLDVRGVLNMLCGPFNKFELLNEWASAYSVVWVMSKLCCYYRKYRNMPLMKGADCDIAPQNRILIVKPHAE